MKNNLDPNYIFNELKKPFDVQDVEFRIGATFKKDNQECAVALPYVSARAIQNRLDETVGVFGWRNEFKEWKSTAQLCGISINVNGEWITKYDGAADSDIESIKGGLSDSFKRSAVMWGIGRYLYDMPTFFCSIEQRGKSKVIPNNELIRLRNLLSNNSGIKNLGKQPIPTKTEPTKQVINENSNKLKANDQNLFNPFSSNSESPQLDKVNVVILNKIKQLAKIKKISIEDILAHYNVNSLDDLSSDQGNNCLALLTHDKVS